MIITPIVAPFSFLDRKTAKSAQQNMTDGSLSPLRDQWDAIFDLRERSKALKSNSQRPEAGGTIAELDPFWLWVPVRYLGQRGEKDGVVVRCLLGIRDSRHDVLDGW